MNISNGEEAEQQIRDIPFVNHLESERKLDPFDVVYGRELQSPILGDRYQLPDLPTCYVPSTTLDTSLLHVRFNPINPQELIKFYLNPASLY